MKRPTITINGKKYELPKPKCGMWRKLLETDATTREVFNEDFIENRCAFLAEAFGGGLTTGQCKFFCVIGMSEGVTTRFVSAFTQNF